MKQRHILYVLSFLLILTFIGNVYSASAQQFMFPNIGTPGIPSSGVFMPGGWHIGTPGIPSSGVFDPGGWGLQGSRNIGTPGIPSSGVFMPGGWHIGTPSIPSKGVFDPGGWGLQGSRNIGTPSIPSSGVFMPGGWHIGTTIPGFSQTAGSLFSASGSLFPTGGTFPPGGSLFPGVGTFPPSGIFPPGGGLFPIGGGIFPPGGAFPPWGTQPPSSTPPPPNPVADITISAESPFPVGTINPIIVEAYDKNGKLTNGGKLILCILSLDGDYGGDYDVELTKTKQSKGVYSSGYMSEWAGRCEIIAMDTKTNVREVIEVEYIAGPPVDIVFSSSRPQPDGTDYTCTVTFYLADEWGNSLSPDTIDPIVTVPPEWTIENMQYKSNGSYSLELKTELWGVAPITVLDSTSGLSEVYEVTFPPIYYTTEQDLDPLAPLEVDYIGDETNDVDIVGEFGEDTISLTIGVYSLAQKELGAYQMEIFYDSNALQPIDFRDPNPSDGYPLPEWDFDEVNSSILINGTGAGGIGGVEVVVVDFEPLQTGPATATVTNLQLSEITYVSGGYILVPIEIPVPFWDTITILKPLKRLIVPIKKWIVDAEGDGVTDAEKQAVRDELDEAEKVFHEAAKKCVIDYWILFIVEFNEISKEKWEEYTGPDGKLNPAERGNMHDKCQYPPDKWVNIYNVPPCSLISASGGSYIGVRRSSGGIWTDKSKDTHDRNIAHEMVHEFSKSDVKDSPKPNASTQGGRDPNNIMRYCGGGKEISGKQGELINGRLGTNSRDYDCNSDGTPEGRIYRP